MRKISTLLMLFCMFVSTAWAQTADIKVSTTVSNPEYQYALKNKNNVWMTSYTSTTQTKPGKFAFFASGEDYQIYSIDRQKWVSYAKADSYSAGTNKIVLVDEQTSANTWKATKAQNGGVDVYQFAPYKNSGVASIYMNWHGGVDYNALDNEATTVGFYTHNAGQDAGSAWVLTELVVPVAGEKYLLQDKGGACLDLVDLGEEPNDRRYNQLATLSDIRKPLYITVDNGNNWSWSIHTTAEGGKYLHQYTNDRQWNSRVNEEGANFRWIVELVANNGVLYHKLRHESGVQNGYLSSSNPVNGEPLYVNNGANIALNLKLMEYQEGYQIVGPIGATVTYNGTVYTVGETIVPEGELTAENLTVTAPERDGYKESVAVDNENKAIIVSYVNNLQAGHKIILKNKLHNTYLGVMLEGGKLDNSTVPTTKLLTGFANNNNYMNCWELVAAGEEACFYLYNPYYDWYACPISSRNGRIALSKTIDEAGRFQIENYGDYIVFKCLNGVNTGHVYLHQVDWRTSHNGFFAVDWDANADASQWVFEVVSADTENNWLTAITTEVANKKAYLEACELGNELGQYSGIAVDDKGAVLEALTIPAEGTTTEKIKAGVHGLYPLNSLTLNMPTAGFYRIKSLNGNDANKKGKYWQSNASGNGMELATEKDDVRSIIYLGADKTLVSYGCGNALNQYSAMDAVGSAGKAWTIKENAKVVGAYALFRNGDGYCLSDWDWTGNATYGQNDANAAWEIERVTEVPVAVSAVDYASFYTPVALTLPVEGLKAYYVAEATEGVATLEEITGTIPASTGVLLYVEGLEEKTTFTLTVAENVAEISGNKLAGTVANTYLTQESYVLSAPNGEVGLYKAAINVSTDTSNDGSEEAPNVTYESWLNNGFKAYLPVANVTNTPQGALRFNFGGETTAIESVLNNGVDANAPIYDLSGRCVNNAIKGGIYIQNGKKFIVK